MFTYVIISLEQYIYLNTRLFILESHSWIFIFLATNYTLVRFFSVIQFTHTLVNCKFHTHS